jgi:hypothetical protein
VHTLYNLGPNQQPITNPSTTDVSIGFDGNEFCFDNRHSAKLVWCYNPKADEGLLVQDVATSNILPLFFWYSFYMKRGFFFFFFFFFDIVLCMSHSATLLDGCRTIITTHPARALLCSGGLASLLPMMYP